MTIVALFAICIFAASACDSELETIDTVTPEPVNNESPEPEPTANETLVHEPIDSDVTVPEDLSPIVGYARMTTTGYALSTPNTDGETSVENALANRRSHRNFQNKALTEEQLSQLLWAAYGVTSPSPDAHLRGGLRTSPSAGATYPLEIYAVVGNVEGIEPGVYRYISADHSIERVAEGDVRHELSDAALGQRMVSQAPVTIFYSAIFSRTTDRYGDRGVLYVYIEVGHSAQNVYLQAEALGLGTCAIGAFTDDQVRRLLSLPDDEEPLYLMPVGFIS